MKRIVYLFVALLMMATADSQTLTERQKGLAECVVKESPVVYKNFVTR